MRFDEKAKENLEAAERLLDTHDGTKEPLNNAAATRAYYAAYQAVVDRVLRTGRHLPPAGYFRHDRFPNDAVSFGVLTVEQGEMLEILYERRVKAEYFEDQVDYNEASEAFEFAEKLVRAMLGGTR